MQNFIRLWQGSFCIIAGFKSFRLIQFAFDAVVISRETFSNFELKLDFKTTKGAKDGQAEHWLNHLKMVEHNRDSQIFCHLLAPCKYSPYPKLGRVPSGHIVLQDHHDEVHFRSVKIREF